MGTLIKNITHYYRYVNDELADPRTNVFPLVSSPLPILVIMYVYHRFVKSWGPAFMKDREPFRIKNIIIAYNVIQIALSVYVTLQKEEEETIKKEDQETIEEATIMKDTIYRLLIALTRLYLPGTYSIWCQKIIQENTELEQVVTNHVWLYYIIKIIDLLDTVFFILRKKFSHVSFLHVYHHLGMCFLGFVGTKYVPGGHGVMLGFINSVVHSVMYTYYLISIVKKEWVRAWWKKYITQLQILQFLLLILHFGHVLFEPSCEYPKWVSFVFLPHNIFILFLFTDFYIKEYIYKKAKKET